MFSILVCVTGLIATISDEQVVGFVAGKKTLWPNHNIPFLNTVCNMRSSPRFNLVLEFNCGPFIVVVLHDGPVFISLSKLKAGAEAVPVIENSRTNPLFSESLLDLLTQYIVFSVGL